MNVSKYSRREFIKKNTLGCAGVVLGSAIPSAVAGAMPLLTNAETTTTKAETRYSSAMEKNGDTLKIAVFEMDATPPTGSYLAYDNMTGSWDLGLRAKGMVLTGAGEPIVLCAIDWIGIANESQDVFKKTIAEAVHTDPKRVAIHTLHQHDAPVCDFSAEKMMNGMKLAPMNFDGSFARDFLARLAKVAEASLRNLRLVTDISTGKAPVYEVASNRRIVEDGKVTGVRFTSCKDPVLQRAPEGLVDPDITLIGFWDGDDPVAIMTFYATHPQSYYRTKIPNPDFPGLARFFRQLAVPDALHIHFTGAGGNIGAGKYNDGSHENRLILAQRLADGMERAWKNSVRTPVTAQDVSWTTTPVALPVADGFIRQAESELKTADPAGITNVATRYVWAQRVQSGRTIDIACLSIGKARVLLAPGELFVEYQLAAKAFRPDLDVSVAAYGEYGPSYICTKEAYSQGGYEVSASPVTGDSEEIILNAFRKLLN